jgi:hypothetical protein
MNFGIDNILDGPVADNSSEEDGAVVMPLANAAFRLAETCASF